MARTVQIVIDCATRGRRGVLGRGARLCRRVAAFRLRLVGGRLRAWGVPEDSGTAPSQSSTRTGTVPGCSCRRCPRARPSRTACTSTSGSATRPTTRRRDAALLAEVERLEALGAVRQEWRFEEGKHFMVMQDVEGNEFSSSPDARRCRPQSAIGLSAEHVVRVDDPVGVALLGQEPLAVRGELLVDGVAGDDRVEAGGRGRRPWAAAPGRAAAPPPGGSRTSRTPGSRRSPRAGRSRSSRPCDTTSVVISPVAERLEEPLALLDRGLAL